MSRNSFEMSRGPILMHVVTTPTGGLRGEDVYDKKRRDLVFKNYHHMRAFAAKHNFKLTAINNT